MVYIINSHLCYDSDYELAKKRNQLFTAITRSKAWVRVLGVGPDMDNLIQEYNKVKSHNFRLDFIYPDEKQREKMNIINRDMSTVEKNKLRKVKSDLMNLIEQLEKGDIYREDFGTEELDRLRNLLNAKE